MNSRTMSNSSDVSSLIFICQLLCVFLMKFIIKKLMSKNLYSKRDL